MWMLWNPVWVNHSVHYAEIAKISHDQLKLLSQQDANENGDSKQPPPKSNQSKLVDHLSKIGQGPIRIKFQQHTLCDYCQDFIMHLLIENVRLGDTTGRHELRLPSNSDRLIYCDPRARSIRAITSSVMNQDCWICAHAVANAWRDGRGLTKTTFTSLTAFDFSSDEFTMMGHGGTIDKSFLTNFRITPIEEEQASQPRHEAFDVRDKIIDTIPADRALMTLMGLSEESDPPLSISWGVDGLAKALSWLHECEHDHVGCRRVEGDISTTVYPSRILDLAKYEDGRVKLAEGSILQSEGAEYATLSHCWGNVRQALLRKKNLEGYKQEIVIDTLPRTFVEAIGVCVDLGIRYLWIDSLCIIQDDKEDWMAEAPRMAEVYLNSRLTLAATASSRDADGLHNPLFLPLVTPLVFHISSGDDNDDNGPWFSVDTQENFQTYVNNSPLNKRAWVLQERALSRRILHFGNDQLYWQCASDIKAQFHVRFDDWYEFETDVWRSMTQWDPNVLKPTAAPSKGVIISHGQPDDHALLTKWNDLIQAYSHCQLTYTTDKLIAVSGLAKRVQTLTSWPESDYLAGLWRQGLPRRLLWTSASPAQTTPNANIPSWSWAHVNNPIYWPSVIWTETGQARGTIVAELLSASTTPVHTALGSVKGGQLKLKAPMCRLRLHRSLLADADYIAAKVYSRGQWVKIFSVTDHCPLDIEFDLKTSWTEIFGRDVFFMSILNRIEGPLFGTGGQKEEEQNEEHDGEQTRQQDQEQEPIHALYGLMLSPTGSKKGQYRRVGFMRVDSDAYAVVNEALSASQLPKKNYLEVDERGRYVFEIV